MRLFDMSSRSILRPIPSGYSVYARKMWLFYSRCVSKRGSHDLSALAQYQNFPFQLGSVGIFVARTTMFVFSLFEVVFV